MRLTHLNAFILVAGDFAHRVDGLHLATDRIGD
jgi:hypothetical protein